MLQRNLKGSSWFLRNKSIRSMTCSYGRSLIQFSSQRRSLQRMSTHFVLQYLVHSLQIAKSANSKYDQLNHKDLCFLVDLLSITVGVIVYEHILLCSVVQELLRLLKLATRGDGRYEGEQCADIWWPTRSIPTNIWVPGKAISHFAGVLNFPYLAASETRVPYICRGLPDTFGLEAVFGP